MIEVASQAGLGVVTPEIQARQGIPARLRELTSFHRQPSSESLGDSERVAEIAGTLDAMSRAQMPASRRETDVIVIPQVVEPRNSKDRPEPPVVKKRFLDWYPWLFLGDPKKVAEKVANNPGSRPNYKRIKTAISTELKEVHLSDSRLFFNRRIERGWNFVKNQLAHFAVKSLVAIPEAIPFAGQAVAAYIAYRQGRPNEIKLHLLGELPFDILSATTVAVLAPFIGPFAFLGAVPFIAVDVVMNAAANKHAREVNNQLIPPLAKIMSDRTQPTPQVQQKRRYIAQAMGEIFTERTRVLKRRRGEKWITDLPKEERHLDPYNGLSKRKRRDYEYREEEVAALSDAVEVYSSLLDPRIPLSRPDLVTLFREVAQRSKLIDKKTGLLKQGRVRRMVARDLDQLRYFYRRYDNQKNMKYDHPYLEARRLNQMWHKAMDFLPQSTRNRYDEVLKKRSK